MDIKVVDVIDSIMGSGKSTWAFNHMYNEKGKKFIYITPYLDEIERLLYEKDHRGEIKKDSHGNVVGTKWYKDRYFREPKQMGEGKLDSLHELLVRECNIATTHNLFKISTQETIDLISLGNYTLILDEAMDVIDIFDMPVKDYNMLLVSKNIKVDQNGRVYWQDVEYDGTFEDFKRKCENGTIIEIKKTDRVQLLSWNFNVQSFNCFKEIYIMTYLFDASLLKYYFEMHNVPLERFTIENSNIIKYENKSNNDKSKYKELINIYEGSLNNIGDKESALSLNWFKKNKDLKNKLKNNIYNYFRNILNAKRNDIMWTTFKSCYNSLGGDGYKSSFVSCNIKATNEYQHCNALAYCCNRYLSPDYIHYFEMYDITVNQDMFALSELVQWMWRSSIRVGKPVNIYIPSRRMRELFIGWLNNSNL